MVDNRPQLLPALQGPGCRRDTHTRHSQCASAAVTKTSSRSSCLNKSCMHCFDRFRISFLRTIPRLHLFRPNDLSAHILVILTADFLHLPHCSLSLSSHLTALGVYGLFYGCIYSSRCSIVLPSIRGQGRHLRGAHLTEGHLQSNDALHYLGSHP